MKSQEKSVNNNIIINEEEEEEYIPDIEIAINDFDIFNQEILSEINYAREFPGEYALKLEDILKAVKDKNENYLFLENVPFIYNDLSGSLNDSIKFLKAQKKLPPLKYEQSISDSCENLLNMYVNNQNYKNNDSSFENRIKICGKIFGENYEIINYDIFDPEFLIINLILSDGDKSLFARKVIFNSNIKYIGIISGILPPNKICIIIDFSEEFHEKSDKIDENKFKGKKNIYNSKVMTSKKSYYKKEIERNSWYSKNKKENKDIKNKNKGDNTNNNQLRGAPKKQIIQKSIFDYDLENFDEEEFFEKEFDTNYGKYEKDKNSHKKMFSTTTTTEKGVQKTITTTIVENIDRNGIKRGYFIEKEENNRNKYNKEREKEYIEKEKRDMKILKEMEKKEKERMKNNKIKEIPLKLKGKKDGDEREYLDKSQEKDENIELPEDAINIDVQHKTITDENGEPKIETTKTITYKDGSIQQFIESQ